MAAVRLAELLMTKHPTLYAKHFRKEGVVHALQSLAASAPEAMEQCPEQPGSPDPSTSSPQRSRPSTRSRVSPAPPPPQPPPPGSTPSWAVTHYLQDVTPQQGSAAAMCCFTVVTCTLLMQPR